VLCCRVLLHCHLLFQQDANLPPKVPVTMPSKLKELSKQVLPHGTMVGLGLCMHGA
jgi:hypothetical protein